MSWAVRITEPGNLRGCNLDPSARRRQGRRHGVAAKCPHDPAVPGQGPQCQLARFPELVELGSLRPALQQSTAGRLVKMPEPLACRSALGEARGDAEALGQRRKDVVIVAR